MKKSTLFLLCCLGSLIISCATIMNPDMVNVPVTTTPPSAKLVINGQEYRSPATVQAPRGKGDFKLHIEKEGYEPIDIMLTQSPDGWLWGNVLFGGLIGLAVDFITGDAYDFDPEYVSVELQKSHISLRDGANTHIVVVDLTGRLR